MPAPARAEAGFDRVDIESKALVKRAVQFEVLRRLVIPARAGIHSHRTYGQLWMAAFAGMTRDASPVQRRRPRSDPKAGADSHVGFRPPRAFSR